MVRRARTSSDVQERFAKGRRNRSRSLKPGQDLMDKREITAAVCKLLCKGHTATEICQHMKSHHGVELTREEPYQYVQYAASHGFLRYAAPAEHVMRGRLKEQYPWLQGIEVVSTGVYDDVACNGASMLVDLVCKHHAPPYNRKEVHVGFAGGFAMRKLAQRFAELLEIPRDDLPPRVQLHALVSGFDLYEPTTDPNTYFSHFVGRPAMQTEISFVGLHAPAVVRKRQLRGLRTLYGIKEAYQRVPELDIIVTSAGDWSDEHNPLLQLMKTSPDSMDMLRDAGCVGDMLWRPLGRQGPINIETEIRAMVLVELGDLEAFISSGKHVLLALGPCGRCNKPKGRILQTILDQQIHLITHLVTDSRSLRQAFDGES